MKKGVGEEHLVARVLEVSHPDEDKSDKTQDEIFGLEDHDIPID